MKAVFFYYILFCFPLVTWSKTVEKTLATVDGEMITLLDTREIQQRLKNGFFKDSILLSLFKEKDLKTKQTVLLDFLIYKKLLELSSQEENITINDSQLASEIDRRQKRRKLSKKGFSQFLVLNNFTHSSYKEFLKKHLQQTFLIQREVIEKIQISNNDLNEYAIRNKQRPLFSSYEYDLSYILFPLTPDGLESIKSSASQLSQNPSIIDKWQEDGQTGVLNKLSPSSMHPDLKKEITSLSPGQTSRIVTLPSGYHIFKIRSQTPVILQRDKTRQQKLFQKLLKTLVRNKLKVWLEERKKSSFIHISS